MAIPGDIYVAGPAVNPRRATTHPCTMEKARISEFKSTKQLLLLLEGALKNDGRRVEIDVDVRALMKAISLDELFVIARAVNLELDRREGRRAKETCEHEPQIDGDRGRCRICGEDLGWRCPKSKTRVCVYNDAEDPSHDRCIWCDLPEERL